MTMSNNLYKNFTKPLAKRIHSRKPFWLCYLIGNALELRSLTAELSAGEHVYTLMPCTWRPSSTIGRKLARNLITFLGLVGGLLVAYFLKANITSLLVMTSISGLIFAIVGSLVSSSGAIMVVTDKKALLLDINPLGSFFRKSRRAIPWSKTTAPNIDSVGFFSKLSIPTASDDDDNIRVTGLWGRDGDFLYKAVLAAQEAHGATIVSSQD